MSTEINYIQLSTCAQCHHSAQNVFSVWLPVLHQTLLSYTASEDSRQLATCRDRHVLIEIQRVVDPVVHAADQTRAQHTIHTVLQNTGKWQYNVR